MRITSIRIVTAAESECGITLEGYNHISETASVGCVERAVTVGSTFGIWPSGSNDATPTAAVTLLAKLL